ncbi:MAG: PspC domain-containing protein [bacterium]
MRRFVRIRQGKKLLGVAQGLAVYTGIDPLLVRVALVALAVIPSGGLATVALYFILAGLTPLVDLPPGDSKTGDS